MSFCAALRKHLSADEGMELKKRLISEPRLEP
jgi:hypothetical protein